jgi:hypothetical protein
MTSVTINGVNFTRGKVQPMCPVARYGDSQRTHLFGAQKIFSTVFAGQAVDIQEVHDDIWLVSFMDYDLGYFDLETRVLEPLDNPLSIK